MNNPTLASLQQEIDAIKARKISIAILTYLTILIFFFVIKVEKPFMSAIVPTLGFVLSTLSLPFIKSWWKNKQSGS